MKQVQELRVGQTYRNRNGWDYKCLWNGEPGVAELERVSDGWRLLACGICMYEDGSIEWDRSVGGHWPGRLAVEKKTTRLDAWLERKHHPIVFFFIAMAAGFVTSLIVKVL